MLPTLIPHLRPSLQRMLRACYARAMETISQRELRNNSAAVIRGLEEGRSYRLTNRGVAVGVLLPLGASVLEDHVVREGTQDMEFPPGVAVPERTDDVLAELRRER